MATTNSRILRLAPLAALVLNLIATIASAQSYVTDARKIGMNSLGDIDIGNSEKSQTEPSYKSIPLPLGLIQVYRDRSAGRFDSSSPSFDPTILLEDLSNPLHFTFGRGADDHGFVKDLVNGTVSRDLNAYRGFRPAETIRAGGLASPKFGHTFELRKDNAEPVHSIYVGAGPYLSLETAFNVDQLFERLFGSSDNVRISNASLKIGDQTTTQGAFAITGGYRGRFASAGKVFHLSTNYHYLHGMRYDKAAFQYEFDTDSAGLLTSGTSQPAAVLDHVSSSSGKGFAVDASTGASGNRWRVTLSANGIANRITWKDLRDDRFTLNSLSKGRTYTKEHIPLSATEETVRLPIRYAGSAACDFSFLTGSAEFVHGFQGLQFQGGFEARMPRFQIRGGGRYSLDRWHPTAGVGIDITRRLSFDLAGFQTTANVERRGKIGIAASLRLNRIL